MAAPGKLWVPDRRDMIWIDYSPQVGAKMKDEHRMMVLSPKAFNERTNLVIGLPMTHAQSNDSNPFAVRFKTAKGQVCYVLAHQPKSFPWRNRRARPHPWKQVPPSIFEAACEELNGIISIREALHNSSRFVIGRTRAVCGVGFLANILDICCKNRLASHPDPCLHDSAMSYAELP